MFTDGLSLFSPTVNAHAECMLCRTEWEGRLSAGEDTLKLLIINLRVTHNSKQEGEGNNIFEIYQKDFLNRPSFGVFASVVDILFECISLRRHVSQL